MYFTLITSMFMHGGLMHLLGNMLFLWIFGDNVEDDARPRYLAFLSRYRLAASLTHVISTVVFGANPLIPCLGASGAISGVMGGYLMLHPHRRVTVIMLRMVTEVPGYVAMGLWFLFQLISALAFWAGSAGRRRRGIRRSHRRLHCRRDTRKIIRRSTANRSAALRVGLKKPT